MVNMSSISNTWFWNLTLAGEIFPMTCCSRAVLSWHFNNPIQSSKLPLSHHALAYQHIHEVNNITEWCKTSTEENCGPLQHAWPPFSMSNPFRANQAIFESQQGHHMTPQPRESNPIEGQNCARLCGPLLWMESISDTSTKGNFRAEFQDRYLGAWGLMLSVPCFRTERWVAPTWNPELKLSQTTKPGSLCLTVQTPGQFSVHISRLLNSW
jgi:hypothetical protein